MDRAIEINHLSVVFHTESGQVHAVKDVSLTLKHGVITGLIGETGSGKSVMASAILRMLPFYAEVSGNGDSGGGSSDCEGSEEKSYRADSPESQRIAESCQKDPASDSRMF